jgi:small subunit ribosomal protein S13
MIYIFESNIPDNKPILNALTYVYGIGRSQALFIVNKLGFSANLKVKDLTKEQFNKLTKILQLFNKELAGDLKKKNIIISKRLTYIKSYRGLRRNQGLPVRGQRTRTNSKTARKRY